MRRKANAADILYIQTNSTTMTVEQISEELDLAVKAIEPYFTPARKEKKLGRSKIKLANGQSVIQMTEDIDPPRGSRQKPLPTQDGDTKAGIYRGN